MEQREASSPKDVSLVADGRIQRPCGTADGNRFARQVALSGPILYSTRSAQSRKGQRSKENGPRRERGKRCVETPPGEAGGPCMFFFDTHNDSAGFGSLQIQTCVAIRTDADVHEAPLPLYVAVQQNRRGNEVPGQGM